MYQLRWGMRTHAEQIGVWKREIEEPGREKKNQEEKPSDLSLKCDSDHDHGTGGTRGRCSLTRGRGREGRATTCGWQDAAATWAEYNCSLDPSHTPSWQQQTTSLVWGSFRECGGHFR